jgi:MFS family permease
VIEITSIDIAGIKILEPVTTLTDLMVTAVCFYAFVHLRSHKHKEIKHVKYYRYFFLFMGIATLLGGLIGHAFLYLFTFAWKVPAWIVSMISIALAERAAIMRARPLMHNHLGKFFTYLNGLELVTFMFIAVYTLKFIYVEIHAMYGLLIVVFSFEGYVYYRTRDNGSKKILVAVFLAALAASAHIGKITISKWFNYFDLAHVLMTISCAVLFLAVKEMVPELSTHPRKKAL